MKRTVVSLSVAVFILVLISSTAFPWGSATHLYIADHLGRRCGLSNINEMYGGMAPDIFNYLFVIPEFTPFRLYLHDQAHGTPGDESFMKVWESARWCQQRSLAFGFLSHNDVWGADYTAHHEACTTGIDEGYIIAKARWLEGMLAYAGVWAGLGLEGPYYDALRLELCHIIVESAGDILIKKADAMIGYKMAASSLLRSPLFPLLLVRAYAGDLSRAFDIPYTDAAKIIITAERTFKENTLLLGQILIQDETQAVESTAAMLAELAVGYLASAGITLPPYVTPDVLKGTAEFALSQAVSAMPDYMGEFDATIDLVRQGMKDRAISY